MPKTFYFEFHKTSVNRSFLKVVSTTFLLVYFLSLKESTCETRKNGFYFTSKALFVCDKMKFLNFRYLDFMMSSMPDHETRNTFN